MDRAYSLGATDYIHRPFHTLVVRRRIENTLMLYAKQRRLTSLVSQQVLDKEKLSSMLLGIFGSVVEAHNGENNQHILRVRTITEALLHQLAKETLRYRLTEEEIIRIGMASALHDIGKSRVPEAILKKPGPLTAEERAIMETHTTAGAAIIKDLYRTYIVKDNSQKVAAYNKSFSKLSFGATLVIGIITYFLALDPPDIIFFLNLFAMGGLECAFFMPLVGAFCRFGTKQGAIAAALGGCAVYVFCYYNVTWQGVNAVVWGLLASVILYLAVSKATVGKGLDQDILEKCF